MTANGKQLNPPKFGSAVNLADLRKMSLRIHSGNTDGDYKTCGEIFAIFLLYPHYTGLYICCIGDVPSVAVRLRDLKFHFS